MTTPVLTWEAAMQSFLTARIAEVEYDEQVWTPAWDDNNRSMAGPAKQEIDVKMEVMQDARIQAEDVLMLTPTSDAANVRWKLAYSLIRYEGFCGIPDDWWDSINADLDRVAAFQRPGTDDAELYAAYESWRSALAIYNVPRDRDDNGVEQAAMDLICAQEGVIREATATTPKGVEIQLWAFMENSTNDQKDNEAIQRGDIQHFVDKGGDFDWDVRLVIAAIASLQAMQGLAA